MLIPTAHVQALRHIHAALAPTRIVWALTGSTGFALQGVPVTVNDIDLQTTAEGAYAIERLLLAHPAAGEGARSLTPVRLAEAERIRSHFGALAIDGVTVEIMGAIQKRAPGSPWEPPTDLVAHRRLVAFAELRLPVLSLAYEHEAYLRLGRVERAEQLRRWLEEHGPAAGGAGEEV